MYSKQSMTTQLPTIYQSPFDESLLRWYSRLGIVPPYYEANKSNKQEAVSPVFDTFQYWELLLTNLNLVSHKWDIGKQYRPRSDAA